MSEIGGCDVSRDDTSDTIQCCVTMSEEKIAMMMRLAINKQMVRAVSPCALDSV